MASPSWWTWVWASSRSWWWTGKPGVLHSMGPLRIRHDWVTEQQQLYVYIYIHNKQLLFIAQSCPALCDSMDEPMSLTSPELAGGFFTTSPTWEVLPWVLYPILKICLSVSLLSLPRLWEDRLDRLPLCDSSSGFITTITTIMMTSVIIIKVSLLQSSLLLLKYKCQQHGWTYKLSYWVK